MEFHAGQCWTFHAPGKGYENARILIGAVASFSADRSIVCCAVKGLPRPSEDGDAETYTIPFLPMSPAALRATVIAHTGSCQVPESFFAKLKEWYEDPNGHTAFTVPFEGSLERMIGLQMAEIAARSSAA